MAWALPKGRVPPCSVVAAKRALVFFCATWSGARARARVTVRARIGVKVRFRIRDRVRARDRAGSGPG